MVKTEHRRAGSPPVTPDRDQLRGAAARADGENAAPPECEISVAISVQSGIATNTYAARAGD